MGNTPTSPGLIRKPEVRFSGPCLGPCLGPSVESPWTKNLERDLADPISHPAFRNHAYATNLLLRRRAGRSGGWRYTPLSVMARRGWRPVRRWIRRLGRHAAPVKH